MVKKHNKKEKARISLISPKDMTNSKKIFFPFGEEPKQLGEDKDHLITFIGKNNKKQVFFPESKYHNKKYYIVDMSFSPNITQSIQTKGRAGSAFAGGLIAGPVGAAIGASRKRKSKVESVEKTSTCYVNLIDTNLKNAYTMKLMFKTKEYQEFANDYMLSDFELKQIEEKINGLDNDAKEVNNDAKDVNSRLKNLKSLLDNNLINEEDFEAKKKQILGI